MKNFNVRLLLFILVLTTGIFSSCKSKPKDSDIEASYNEKARADAQLANITATANEGVVTLNGQCPDEACKTNAENNAREIKGVTSVVNNITVAQSAAPPPPPVEVAGDDALTQGVRDATKDHPGVKAEVVNGEITLTGDIKRSDLPKLMQSLNSLKPKKINNQLTIK